MFQKLASTRSFEVLNGQHFKIAINEIETKFWDWMGKRPAAQRCHETVAMPFKRALERGGAPKMLLMHEGKKGADYYFIEVAGEVFPMRVRKRDWNPVELAIFPPIKPWEVKQKKFDDDGLAGIYGKDVDKVDSITVAREHAPTTHVRFKDGEMFHNESFAWAMWESASLCVRRALADFKAAEPVMKFDPVLERDIKVAPPERYGRALKAVIGSIGKPFGQRVLAGPPAAHDLLAAFTWNGKAVAVTSQRPIDVNGKKVQSPIKIWTHEKVGGNLVWVEVPPPRDGKLPMHGATAALDGNTLRIFGGTNEEGDPVKTHFAYDLGAANRDRHKAELWRQEMPLDEARAWPAVIAADRDLLVAGGVAGYFIKAAEDRDKAKTLSHRRDLKTYGRLGWKARDPLKIDITGASSAFGKGCAFIGPGSEMTGRCFIFDMNEGDALFELPKLPKEVGFGQMFLEGSRLVYAGGFEKGGNASTSIYELDLEDVEPKWTKLGDSSFTQGSSRVVESHGQVMSLMIAPGKSAAFPVGDARGW